MMPRIDKATLAARLGAAIGQEVGIEGLNTLLYGWKKKRRFGARYLDALKHRDWLYITEVMDLSDYAGYDLTARMEITCSGPEPESECAHPGGAG